MCLATVYGKKSDTESVILKNATRIDVDGKKIVIRDIIGMETVVEGEILTVDLANGVVKIAVTTAQLCNPEQLQSFGLQRCNS